jgi:hypothetical protein
VEVGGRRCDVGDVRCDMGGEFDSQQLKWRFSCCSVSYSLLFVLLVHHISIFSSFHIFVFSYFHLFIFSKFIAPL